MATSRTVALLVLLIAAASRTAPYMHDGSLATLEEVVDFYKAGGRANPHIDPEIHPLRLATGEKQALVVFLKSLSGTIREGVQ